jgi:hypothetical protein
METYALFGDKAVTVSLWREWEASSESGAQESIEDKGIQVEDSHKWGENWQ